MASFGVVNPTVAARVHPAAGVSAVAVKAVTIAANASSLLTLFLPVLTYVVPTLKNKNVGDKKIWGFLGGFFTSLLFLLYTIPSKHHHTLVLIVNCIALGVEAVYVCIFLVYTAKENQKFNIIITVSAAAIASAITFFFLMVVILSHTWSVKIIGIFAATFSTAIFVGGLVNVWFLVEKQVSAFNIYQLLANLESTAIWSAFGFIFTPVICYTVIPNLAGFCVTMVQIVFHTILYFKKARAAATAAAARNAAATLNSNGGDIASGNGVDEANSDAAGNGGEA